MSDETEAELNFWPARASNLCEICGFDKTQCSCNGKQKNLKQKTLKASVDAQVAQISESIEMGYAKKLQDLEKRFNEMFGGITERAVGVPEKETIKPIIEKVKVPEQVLPIKKPIFACDNMVQAFVTGVGPVPGGMDISITVKVRS